MQWTACCCYSTDIEISLYLVIILLVEFLMNSGSSCQCCALCLVIVDQGGCSAKCFFFFFQSQFVFYAGEKKGFSSFGERRERRGGERCGRGKKRRERESGGRKVNLRGKALLPPLPRVVMGSQGEKVGGDGERRRSIIIITMMVSLNGLRCPAPHPY